MKSQLIDLQECLPEYSIYGAPRDNSTPNPLYNPVLIHTKSPIKLEVVRSGTFWLSDTPNEKSSKLASSKEPRICSWVELNAYGCFKPIYVATTHLAYRSMRTATGQIRKLMSHISENIIPHVSDKDGNIPKNGILHGKYHSDENIILTGDFNWESNSTVYSAMKNVFGMSNTMENSMVRYPALTALPPYPGLIDYVWQTGFRSMLSATLTDQRKDNGRYMSDHRPVVALLGLEDKC